MPEEKRKQTLERLRGLSDAELATELKNLRARLYNLRRDHVSRQLENTAAIPHTKREIARVLTLIAERQIAAKRTAKEAGKGAE
jgi:large subunit ribosomal protein L29